MRKPQFLFGLIVVMLGSIWTLQGAGLVDGMIFNGGSVAVAAGLVTMILGAIVMAWTRLRRPRSRP